ncbi:MAG: glutamate synthase central domain-containing protein, partial [Planctomycetota bacterium]
AGIMTDLPLDLLRSELVRHEIHSEKQLAAGMLFCPPKQCDHIRAACASILTDLGLELLLWRSVPTNTDAIGKQAASTQPAIRMPIIALPDHLSETQAERLLYIARKRLMKSLQHANFESTHVASLSSQTIVYKGLVTPGMLPVFYSDLTDQRFLTRMVMFHQRFSTNTRPSWSKAQPFRYCAHNGEINTIHGNRAWLDARQNSLVSETLGEHIHDVLPIVDHTDSDSASFDKLFELLVRAGRCPERTITMMVPEPHQHMPDMHPDLRAMFEYNSALLEPWGGPGAFVFADGGKIGAALDRNGLRPMRYWIRKDGLIVVASEAGVVPSDQSEIIEKGRLGPGHVIIADLNEGKVNNNETVKLALGTEHPYSKWIAQNMRCHEREGLKRTYKIDPALVANEETRTHLQRSFAYSRETIERIIEPMSKSGSPPVGSMGDDTPLAVFSEKPQSFYRYFKQRFAQVTNPPIDPIREELVMSLQTAIGRRRNLLSDGPQAASLIRFPSPILTDQDMTWCLQRAGGVTLCLDTTFAVADGAQAMVVALDRICDAAEESVRGDTEVLLLTDRAVNKERAAIPALLVTAAVHQRLVTKGLRLRASVIVETGDVFEDHHYACLLGYGATMIHPYLALASSAATADDPVGESGQMAVRSYVRAVEAGLRKVMSKVGVANLHSYRGAQMFEAVGISDEIIQNHFVRTSSSLSGVTLEQIASDILRL